MAECVVLGKKLYYEIHGSGEPVVFLNGMMMTTKSYKFYAKHLYKKMKVILVDLVDQGQSEPATREYKMEDQIPYLKAFIEHIGLEKVHLTGVSYGGAVAMTFAIMYPEMVKSLTFYNTFPVMDHYMEEALWLWRLVCEIKDEVKMKRAIYPIFYSRSFYLTNYDKIMRVVNKKTKNLPEHYFDSLSRLIESISGFNILDRLGEITAPTLVCSSDEDIVAPPYYQKLICEKIKHADFLELKGTGHAAVFEKPSLFIGSLLGHICSL